MPGWEKPHLPSLLLLLAEVQERLWGTWGNGGRIEAKAYGSESPKFPCPDHPCRAWRGTVTSVVGAGEQRDLRHLLWHLLWHLSEQRPHAPAPSAFPGPRPGSQPSFALKYLGSSRAGQHWDLPLIAGSRCSPNSQKWAIPPPFCFSLIYWRV